MKKLWGSYTIRKAMREFKACSEERDQRLKLRETNGHKMGCIFTKKIVISRAFEK